MKRMKLSEIKIKESFANTTPDEEKMNECREFWRLEGKQDRPIVLNSKGYLVDGYVMYLTLIEHKEKYAEVISKKKHNRQYEKLPKVKPTYKNTSTTYIFGVHPNSNCKREFCWRVPESWTSWADNVQIGDTVMCTTKFGYSPVVVSKIEILDKCPIDIPVKKVCNKQIRRNGIVVEI